MIKRASELKKDGYKDLYISVSNLQNFEKESITKTPTNSGILAWFWGIQIGILKSETFVGPVHFDDGSTEEKLEFRYPAKASPIEVEECVRLTNEIRHRIAQSSKI